MYRPSAVPPNWQRFCQPLPPLQWGTFQVAATSIAPLPLLPPLLPSVLLLLSRRQTYMRPSLDLVASRPPGRNRCGTPSGQGSESAKQQAGMAR